MLGAIILILILCLSPSLGEGEYRALHLAPPPRTRVKVGVVVPVEEREKEDLINQAVEMYNAKTHWMMVESVTVFTSNEDSLLRFQFSFQDFLYLIFLNDAAEKYQ